MRALIPAGCLTGLALALVSASGAAQDRREPGRGSGRTSYANPSAVIAAELAFARDAQVRGQWTAFAAAAAPDAVMFVPQMVWAQQWLQGRANPPASVRWQPREVWSSCDGTLVASRGVWQAPAPPNGGSTRGGWFTTLWQRQADGAYRWVLDHGDEAGAPGDVPDMIAAHVADCPVRARPPAGGVDPRQAKPPKPPKPPKPRDLPPLDPAQRSGAARDGSLRWAVSLAPDGSRRLTVSWTSDGREQGLLDDRVAAPAPSR